MKTPQVKPDWNTGIYIGDGVVAKPTMEDNMHKWTDQQICEFYDQNPNLLLSTYAGMLGLNVRELKEILFGEWWD